MKTPLRQLKVRIEAESQGQIASSDQKHSSAAHCQLNFHRKRPHYQKLCQKHEQVTCTVRGAAQTNHSDSSLKITDVARPHDGLERISRAQEGSTPSSRAAPWPVHAHRTPYRE